MRSGILFMAMLFIIMGCRVSDEEIRADIASKARDDLNFAGLNYTVADGVVSFTGYCHSVEALSSVKQNIKNIHVIKAVNYQVIIAPVTLDSLIGVKLRMDSLLSKYPQVTGQVKPGEIVLNGKVSRKKYADLLQAIELNIGKKITDQLSID